MLLVTYGINVGVFYAISTLLNTTIVMHFDYEVRKYIILLDVFHSKVHISTRNVVWRFFILIMKHFSLLWIFAYFGLNVQ